MFEKKQIQGGTCNLNFTRLNQPKSNHFIEDYSVILELKFDRNDYFDVNKITQNFPFRVSRFSKYTRGIDLIYQI